MFEGIGRMGDYLKQRDLKLQAKYKMKTGQSLDALKEQLRKNNTFAARTLRAQKTQMTDDMKAAIIRQKLHAGRELSAQELSYLKKNDPDLYAKAKDAQATRTELQQALKRAKTKAEAIRAVAQAQAKVATQAALEAKYGSASGAMANAVAGTAAGGSASMGDSASSAASFDTNGAEEASLEGAAASTQEAYGSVTAGATQEPASSQAAAAGGETSRPEGNVEAEGISSPTEQGAASGKTTAEKEAAAKEKMVSKEAELSATKKALLESFRSAGKSAALPMEKYIYMLAAITDEWAKFANSKDYEELPDDSLSMDKEEEHPSTKKPYRPTGMANVEAAERYKVADSLLADDTTGSLLDLTSQLG